MIIKEEVDEIFSSIEKKIDTLMNSNLLQAVDSLTNGELRDIADKTRSNVITPLIDEGKRLAEQALSNLSPEVTDLIAQVLTGVRKHNLEGIMYFKLREDFPRTERTNQGNLSSEILMSWLSNKFWNPVTFYILEDQVSKSRYFAYYKGTFGASGNAGMMSNMFFELGGGVSSSVAQGFSGSYDLIKSSQPKGLDEFICPGSGMASWMGNEWRVFKIGEATDFKGGSYLDVSHEYIASLSPFHANYTNEKIKDTLGVSDSKASALQTINNWVTNAIS